MPDLPWAEIAVFLAAAAVIAVSGTRLAGLADRLADRTGLGEALMGGLFLGISTSLPGISATVTAALDGYPTLAVSNALGGIAAQTAFLAIADIFHRKANLEHAAASAPNLLQSCLLVLLLCQVILYMFTPAWTIGHVHWGTPLLVLTYGFGFMLVYRSSFEPMWQPERTPLTELDEPEEEQRPVSLWRLWAGFTAAAGFVLVGGVAVARSGEAIVGRTGIGESIMGGIFVAVSTSLPELVTTIAAVRRGALTLAVSDIVGGNAFDVLFVCVADVAYTGGSIYHASGPDAGFLAAFAILLNVILLMGLLQRQRHGVANIGFESLLILGVYLAGVVVMSVAS